MVHLATTVAAVVLLASCVHCFSPISRVVPSPFIRKQKPCAVIVILPRSFLEQAPNDSDDYINSDNDNNERKDNNEKDETGSGNRIDSKKTSDLSKKIKKERELDPLILSLTRTDSDLPPNTATVNAPFLGEIPLDGSIVVLIPAVVIGIAGFVMSIFIAFNAKDTFVDSITELTTIDRTAAPIKTSECRGLCASSSQEESLESMRGFMERFSKTKEPKAVPGDVKEAPSSLDSSTLEIQRADYASQPL